MKISKSNLYALLFTLAYCIFVLPATELIAFTRPTDKKTLLATYALKLSFAIALFFTTNFALNFIRQLRLRNAQYIQWMKFSLLYFAILMVFFILIYPGHWVWDELNILKAVRLYEPFAWQNYLTNVFYTYCLYLIPTGVSIVFIQISFISLVVGYVLSRFRPFIKSKRLVYLLFAFFLMPPILLNNFYPLRLTMYSYLELLLICRLILLHRNRFKSTHPHFELIGLSILITLVAFWRSEGIYYLVLFPIIFKLLKIYDRKVIKTSLAIIFTIMSLSVILIGYLVNHYTQKPSYQLTTMISPLSIMLNQPLRGEKTKEHITDLNKTIDVSLVKEYPDPEEIPSYWLGAVRDNNVKDISGAKSDYFYIVVHNPTVFIKTRLTTFLATNGYGQRLPLSEGVIKKQSADPTEEQMVAEFETQNHFSHPISFAAKQHVTDALLMVRGGKIIAVGHLFWNVITPIVLLTFAWIYSLIMKRYFRVLILSFVLIRAPLIFLTAPANYFMYYLPLYLTGGFLISLALVSAIDNGSYDKVKGKIQSIFLRKNILNTVEK